jgi:DNA polymerase-3 subunit epsilon
MAMGAARLDVLGFDTETTGTAVDRDRIVTAALARRSPDGAVVERTWLIAPDIDIPPGATAVHGITTDYARAHGRPPAEALEAIAAAGAPVVVFNAGFDLPLLDAELARNGLATLPERLGGPVRPVLDPLVLDRGTDRFRKGKRTLAALIEHFGVATGGAAHDAPADGRATIAVLDAILDAHGEVAALGLDALHDWQCAKHREWAVSFNRWLESKGRVPDVRAEWP